MKMEFNVEQLKKRIILSEIIAKDVKVLPDGRGKLKACCPFHKEKTPSFQINDDHQYYYCYGCGAHGDVIDYMMETRKMNFKEAIESLGGGEFVTMKSVAKKAEPKISDDFEGIFPVPADAPVISLNSPMPKIWNIKRESWSNLKPSNIYTYQDKKGQVVGYVLRLNFNGKKITPVITYCENKKTGDRQWCMKALPEKRTLYNLHEVLQNNRQIVVCEGEKAADACKKLLGCNVVSWCGGTNAIDYSDWSVLKGRSVIVWPDADEVGVKAGEKIALLLSKHKAAEIKVINPPFGMEKGYDAADALEAGWTREQAIDWMKLNAKEYEAKKEKVVSKLTAQDRFRMLGYNQGIYYYLPDRAQQVTSLTPSAHSKLNLLTLAPLNWWEANFCNDKGQVNWDMVANALIDASNRQGIFYETSMVRGLGAWLDGEKKVIHLGDRVLVDNVEYSPAMTPTKCIYEATKPINFHGTKALQDYESEFFAEICKEFSWENPLSARLFAGWCVIAPICGMLNWRPHIWITGQSGVGKSTIKEEILTKMLGEFGLFTEGDSTEAGIRQTLIKDAVPVVLDEAEAENRKSTDIITQVIRLARIASSGGSVLKGGQNNNSVMYTIRSMFCFIAINPSISQYADESRITKLILRADKSFGSKERYEQLVIDLAENITDKFAAGMIQRTLNNIDTLFTNIEAFTSAAMDVFKKKRHADQLAPMLAGAYLCYSTKIVSVDEAREWIKDFNWSDQPAFEFQRDEDRVLEALLTRNIRFVAFDGKPAEATLGEAILFAHRNVDEMDREWHKAIKRLGIKIIGDFFAVANKSSPLEKLLQDTAWSKSWGQQLKNIAGAELSGNVYYGPGMNNVRGTKVPISHIQEKEGDE